MIKAFLTVNDELVARENLTEKGVWINLINPTEAEISQVAAEIGIHQDFLRAPLDEEERSRLEIEAGQILVLINIPIEGTADLPYDTIPLGIIATESNVVTVCLRDNPVLNEFQNNRPKTFHTFKKTRFVLQLLFQAASQYLKYLRQIDKRTTGIESRLHKSMQNEELIRLLNLEKSLVYFTTSLKANEFVMEKLLRSQLGKTDKTEKTDKPDSDMAIASLVLKMYPEDEDLLEDVIIENKQAIDMSEIHSNILSGMMDAFASVISNNLNIVMKFLTTVTIIIALPTMIGSFYGMNVALPMQKSAWAFPMIIGVSLLTSLAGVLWLKKKKMF